MRTPALPTGRLPWWADSVTAALVTALYVVELAQWGSERTLSMLGVFAMGGVGIALRRITPLLAFVLCALSIELVTRVAPGFDNDSAALVITFFVMLYSVGRHTAGLERWLGLGGVVVFTALFALDEAQAGLDTGDVAFAAVFVGAPWLAGLTLRIRHDREHTWRARNEALRAEQEERERRAVAAERARIARELHDVVSHAIAVTVLQARGARRMLGVDELSVRRALDAIDHTNTQALSDMRRLLALLRDTEDNSVDAPQPTLDQLPGLVDQVRGSGLPVELRVVGTPDDVPPGVELSAYRIVQEALTNVIKHAGPGARAEVDLRYGDEVLELSVVDDGRGASLETRVGHGLVGIRERVAVVGGQVETRPRDEGGFAVRVRLPYALEHTPGLSAEA
jgi:signal transduction histidine kinase